MTTENPPLAPCLRRDRSNRALAIIYALLAGSLWLAFFLVV